VAMCKRALGPLFHDLARTGHGILAYVSNPSKERAVVLLAPAVHALVGCVAAIAKARALPWKDAPPTFPAANLELVGPCRAFSPHTSDAPAAADPRTALTSNPGEGDASLLSGAAILQLDAGFVGRLPIRSRRLQAHRPREELSAASQLMLGPGNHMFAQVR
jgi:hypothetical protein